VRDTFLHFSPPSIGEEEIDEVVSTLRSDWITTGPKVKQFEEEFSAFVGAPAALALNSCTAALHVALKSLGIGPGDAVVTTPSTFCSTIHVIEHVGARPLLVDVEPDTLNIDPNQVREAAKKSFQSRGSNGSRVKAILPVHLYGHPCDLAVLVDIAREYRLAILEDAAHALPAKYLGRSIGNTFSSTGEGPVNLAAFSFYVTKNLTTGEGGMLTGPAEILQNARMWSLHGMSRDAWKRYSSEGSWHYEVVLPGFKYNMTDIQAAIGLQQLRKLSRFQLRRREIVARYNQTFGQLKELQVPIERPEVEHAWHIYALRLNADRFRSAGEGCPASAVRDQFIEQLKARNIGTSVHFIPIHLQPYYREKYGYKPEDFPVAYKEYQRVISLPLNTRMTDQDVEDVIVAVADVVKQLRA
jgi:dTDP-4-amino-4,6-dideoxygalactose transaminase